MGVQLSSLPPNTAPDLVQLAKVLQAGKYAAVATLSVVVWDWLSCLSVEYRVIWRSRWSWGKLLYILSRYIGIMSCAFTVGTVMSETNEAACMALAPVTVLVAYLCIFASETILALRVAALWGNDRRIVIGLTLLLVLNAAALVASIGMGWVASSLPPFLGGCLPAPRPNRSLAIIVTCWASTGATDLVLFVLMLAKTLRGYYTDAHLPGGGLGKLLLRDGCVYFFSIFATNLVNIILFLIMPANAFEISGILVIGITSVTCCRGFLNLRIYSDKFANLSIPIFPPDETRGGGVALRELSPGEAEMKDFDIRL